MKFHVTKSLIFTRAVLQKTTTVLEEKTKKPQTPNTYTPQKNPTHENKFRTRNEFFEHGKVDPRKANAIYTTVFT